MASERRRAVRAATGRAIVERTAFFDDVYRRYQRYWWRRPTRYSIDPADHATSLIASHLLEALRQHRAGKALDIGAGEGADAIRLALLGYEVDAVEGTRLAPRRSSDSHAKSECG